MESASSLQCYVDHGFLNHSRSNMAVDPRASEELPVTAALNPHIHPVDALRQDFEHVLSAHYAAQQVIDDPCKATTRATSSRLFASFEVLVVPLWSVLL